VDRHFARLKHSDAVQSLVDLDGLALLLELAAQSRSAEAIIYWRFAMTEDCSAELFREEGDPFRSIRLCVHPDGSVKLDAQDMGKAVKEIWGDSDYEFWVDVPATAIHKLVFSLLREKYSGRSGAVDEFCAFCKSEGVEHQWQSWT
jgi:hypothetical protein